MRVTSLRRLDRGVFATRLADGRHWVVRVFSARRPPAEVEGDASVLRFLEAHDFPAERLATRAEAVSQARGWSFLVTEFVEGAPVEATAETLRACGALLGRLHTLEAPAAPDLAARPAGAIHHFSPAGGALACDVDSAVAALDEIEERTPDASRAALADLRRRLASADRGEGLPQALIHPDPVLKNILRDERGELILIDWTGAGCGPRLAPLALLLWAGAIGQRGWAPERVDAIIVGYRECVQLSADELARLDGAIRLRPLVFAAMRFRSAVLAGRSPVGEDWWWPDDAIEGALAERARAGFLR